MLSQRLALAVTVCALALGGCGSPSTSSSSSGPPTLLVITPNPVLTAPALPAFHAPCHAAPQPGKRLSEMIFSGPCVLTQTAAVRCFHQRDDFYAFIHRKLAHGWAFDVTINVEYYSHPDTYTQLTQVFVEVSKGQTLDAWGQNLATATITQGEHSLILQPTIAPGYAGTVQTEPEEISGTLACQGPATTPTPSRSGGRTGDGHV